MENPYADKIKEALKEGYTPDEVNQFLKEKRGVENPDQYTRQVINSSIDEARSQGYKEDEITQHLTEDRNIPKEYLDNMQPSTETFVQPNYTVPEDDKVTMTQPEMQQQAELRAADLSSEYQTIYSKYSTLGKQLQGIYDPKKAQEAQQDIATLNKLIVDKLGENDIDARVNPETGDIEMKQEDGSYTPVDSSMLNDIINRKFEMGGAIAGGIAGAKVPGPWPVKLAGSIIGSAVGASAGRGLDIVSQAAKLKEDLQAGFVWQQMKDAGAADVVMNVVGQPIARGGLATARMLKRAYDFVLGGNVNGAYQLMKDSMFISDEEAKAIVRKWEELNQAQLPGKTPEEKAIAGVIVTQPGSEGVLKAAAATDPKASAVVANQINQRAQQLLQATKDISFDKPAKEFVQALDNYTDDVMTHFSLVKDQGIKQVPDTYYYDVNKLGLDKLKEIAEKNIDGLDAREKLEALLTKIRDNTEKDDFGSLLELRSIVNDFKYNKKLVTPADYEGVNAVLKGIDTEINRVAHTEMKDGKTWLKNWKLAKDEYAKLQRVKKNELIKALGVKFRKDPTGNFERITAKKLDDKKLISNLTRMIGTADNTFDEVLSKLPKKVQGRVEGQVLNELVDKYTAGAEGELRATHFPELAKHLQAVKFRSPKAKQIKRVIMRMSEVYRNDPNLARVSGSISLPRFQSYLTTDPVVRAKFEIASNIFNYIKRIMPGNTANTLSLVDNVGKLLEKPLNQKAVQEYMKNLPKDERVVQEKLVRKLQQAVAQYGKSEVQQKPATMEDAMRILGVDELTYKEAEKPEVLQKLRDAGYQEFQLGDKTINLQGGTDAKK